MFNFIRRKVVCLLLAGIILCLPVAASVVPIADADAELSYAVSITLMHYATQKDIYSEGENEGEGEGEGEQSWDSIFLPWQQYATLGGIVCGALGIIWLAEDTPSPCVVATAAYGTPLAPQINLLRVFRDRVLLDSVLGTAFVDVYYRVGGIAAQFVARHGWAAWIVRAALVPVLLAAALTLLYPHAASAVFGLLLVTAVLIMVYWRLRSWGLRTMNVQSGCKP